MKKTLTLFILSLMASLEASTEFLQYHESLITGCIVEKVKASTAVIENEKHIVYFDQKNNQYIKIYEPNSERSRMWDAAYKKGVFNEVTALKAIILDDNQMFRGYISYRCRPLYPYTVDKSKIVEIDPTFSDYFSFLNMIELMRKKVVETGFFYGDVSNRNFGILNGKCVLFDLDEIVELDKLDQMKNQTAIRYYLFTSKEITQLAKEYIKNKKT